MQRKKKDVYNVISKLLETLFNNGKVEAERKGYIHISPNMRYFNKK